VGDLPVDLLGDAHVVGVGERLRVEVEELLPPASHHLAEGIVGRDDPVLGVGEDHGRHVVLEGEAKAQLGFGQDLAGRPARGGVANRHDAPRPVLALESREEEVDGDLAAVL